jgi:hypothetical protein
VWRAKGLGVRGPLGHGHLSAGDLRPTGEMFIKFGVQLERSVELSVEAESINTHIPHI